MDAGEGHRDVSTVRITVAIPTCDRLNMLEECLSSVVAQATAGVDIVVIDNSPSGSARFAVERRRENIVRYVHEPESGVVYARNRAVRECRGDFLAFIDDDETADTGWIEGLQRQAEAGVDASFGKVVPRLLADAEPIVRKLVDQLYLRDLGLSSGSDATDRWADFGTGNSLFKQATCFPDPDPFPVHLNSFGSEDTWLIRRLVRRGLRLTWNPDSVVFEAITPARMSYPDIFLRKFRNGQARSIMMYNDPSRSRFFKLGFWMVIGTLQWSLHSIAAVGLCFVGSRRRMYHLAQSKGGLGKIQWHKSKQSIYYSSAPRSVTRGTMA